MQPPLRLLSRRSLLLAATSAAVCAQVSAQSLKPASQPAASVTVFAAASLTEVMQALALLFEAQQSRSGNAVKLRFSFAASSTLARQIANGAPADVFISADLAWMDWCSQRNLVQKASQQVVARNRLVIAVRKTDAFPTALRDDSVANLKRLLATGRIATGDPAHVPAGRYALAAIESLGVQSTATKGMLRADNVRSALLFLQRGEADAALVYASDVWGSPTLTVAAQFPASAHPPIVYPAALVSSSKVAPNAAAFLAFLGTAQAQALFVRFGFVAA
jgi:molybdate transport system substrate-binding protein